MLIILGPKPPDYHLNFEDPMTHVMVGILTEAANAAAAIAASISLQSFVAFKICKCPNPYDQPTNLKEHPPCVPDAAAVVVVAAAAGYPAADATRRAWIV